MWSTGAQLMCLFLCLAHVTAEACKCPSCDDTDCGKKSSYSCSYLAPFTPSTPPTSPAPCASRKLKEADPLGATPCDNYGDLDPLLLTLHKTLYRKCAACCEFRDKMSLKVPIVS